MNATVTILAGRPADDGWHYDEVAETPTDAVVAAAGPSSYPVEPPREWFADPKLDGPTMLTIEPSGRVYGHVAEWSSRHIGLPGHVKPPKSQTGYQYFLSGNTLCSDGSTVRTGHLTLGTSHAPLEASGKAASEHYDQTGTCWSDVAAGSDEHGWWVAGALRPDVTPETVRAARGSSLSGDWRDVLGNGQLEPVAALSVNCPGFGIPQPLARVASGAPTAMVAAGVIDVTAPRITLTSPEETPVTASATPTETPTEDTVTEKTDAEAVTASADTPPIVADQAVRVTGELPVALVASVDGDTALVQVEVPTSQLADAGEGGRALLASAQRERLRDREFATLRDELKGVRDELKADREDRAAADADRRALAAAADIPVGP